MLNPLPKVNEAPLYARELSTVFIHVTLAITYGCTNGAYASSAAVGPFNDVQAPNLACGCSRLPHTRACILSLLPRPGTSLQHPRPPSSSTHKNLHTVRCRKGLLPVPTLAHLVRPRRAPLMTSWLERPNNKTAKVPITYKSILLL